MKEKLNQLAKALREAIAENPVEVVWAVLFFFVFIPCDRDREALAFGAWDGMNILRFGLALFLATYLLHAHAGRWAWAKIAYYLSPALLVPVGWIRIEDFPEVYPMTLLLSQLLFLWGTSGRGNDRFIGTTLRYVKAVFLSGAFGTCLFLALMVIFQSVVYIFEWESWIESWLSTFSVATGFALSWPLFFLTFHRQVDGRTLLGKADLILANHILSPALLIYTAILYLYTAKIVVTWDLPKGGVAMMVMAYVGFLFLLKGFQPFLSRRFYDKFYRHASWIALPTLALAWVGAIYRIGEYGYTVPRVYLLIMLTVLTVMAGLFLVPRLASYRTVVGFALVSFSVFSYIPGMTAKDIERRSQAGREPEPEKENPYVYISPQNTPIDIRPYETIIPVSSFQNENDSLSVFQDSTLIYKENLSTLLRAQLRKANLSPADSIPESAYNQLLFIETDSLAIWLEDLQLYKKEDGEYRINYLKPAYCFEKYRKALSRSHE